MLAGLEHETDAGLIALAVEARAALVGQVAELEMDDGGGNAEMGKIAELFLAEQFVPPQVPEITRVKKSKAHAHAKKKGGHKGTRCECKLTKGH
jgi:hypothetical protein